MCNLSSFRNKIQSLANDGLWSYKEIKIDSKYVGIQNADSYLMNGTARKVDHISGLQDKVLAGFADFLLQKIQDLLLLQN